MQFPMILTHRDNPHAQIVVANAEQLADAPAAFLPPASAGTPAVVMASAAIQGVNIADDLADLDAQRAEFSRTVDEFTAHVQTETEQLAAMRTQIDADRSVLDELRAQLEQDRAAFEAQKNSAQPPAIGDATGDAGANQATAQETATGDAAAAQTAPAKRTRAAAAQAAATGTEGV
jgi:hypothetical protein